MSELKFATFEAAMQDLSNRTGKTVKIAWKDESKQLLEDIKANVKAKPGLITKFKKYYQEALEPGEKIAPTNKGGLKLIDDVDDAMLDRLWTSVSKAPVKEVFDLVTADKESFDKFHAKHKKGIQESNGYYRSNPGLNQRVKDKIKGNSKGEQSEEAKAESDKSAEIEKELKPIREIAKKNAKNLPDSDVKDLFIAYFDHPENKKIRDNFIREFSDVTDSGEMDAKEAMLYENILKRFMSRAEKDMAKEFPGFVKSIESLSKDVEKEVDKVEEEFPGTEDSGNVLDIRTGLPKTSSEEDAAVMNVIDTWMGKIKSGE